ASHRAAAAIEQAEPTSPWHPTSAPEIEACSLYSDPIAPAVSRKRTAISSGSTPSMYVVAKWSTAGMMPAAPLVGAVTTRPPAAFSSLTASAARETHSKAFIGRRTGSSADSASYQEDARRFTSSPPG